MKNYFSFFVYFYTLFSWLNTKKLYTLSWQVLQDLSWHFFNLYKTFIMEFIKDSFRELKHVVWPTKEETIKYFIIVLITLILFGVYLTIADYAFRESLFGLQNLFSK